MGLHYTLRHILIENRPNQLLRRLRVGYLSVVVQLGAYFSFPLTTGTGLLIERPTKETHGESKERKEWDHEQRPNKNTEHLA